MKNNEKTMEKVVALCKGRGFVFPGSEIYGGLANTWDYGPLGVELKNNVKKAWWKKFVQENPYNVGLDAAILMNPQVWVASGHVGGFSDPLMDCKECKERLPGGQGHRGLVRGERLRPGQVRGRPEPGGDEGIYARSTTSPAPPAASHNWTDIRQFNLMFKTFQGVTEDAKNTVYLRPETAQGIFVNFQNVQRTTRKKLPFGVCQIGKSFRNEITPGNFTFRTREFEQMELEFFCKPGTELDWFASTGRTSATSGCWTWACRRRTCACGTTSPRSSPTTPTPPPTLSSLFPFGWGELWGVADRTNYDLTAHQTTSGKDQTYFDQETERALYPLSSSSPPWVPTG